MLPLGVGEFSAVPGPVPIAAAVVVDEMVAAPANVRLALRPDEIGEVTRKSVGALGLRPDAGAMVASVSGFCRLLTLPNSVPRASDSADKALSTKPTGASVSVDVLMVAA